MKTSPSYVDAMCNEVQKQLSLSDTEDYFEFSTAQMVRIRLAIIKSIDELDRNFEL